MQMNSVDDNSSFETHLVVIDQVIAMARLNPVVACLRGLPGSGKSLLASRLALRFQHLMFEEYGTNKFSSTILSADQFFLSDKHGENGEPLGYVYDGTKIADAHDYCMRRFLDETESDSGGLLCDPDDWHFESTFLRPTRLIIIDNTNTTAMEMSPYLCVGAARRYTGVIIEVGCDFETALARNVHGVPRESAAGLQGNMLHLLPPWWNVLKVQG